MKVEYPKAEFMLARLFATVLFGVMMFVIGYMSGEYRAKLEFCLSPVTKQSVYMTPLEQKRWIAHYLSQGGLK